MMCVCVCGGCGRTIDNDYIRDELKKYEGKTTLVSQSDVSLYPLHREVAQERRSKADIYLLYRATNPEDYPSATGIMVDEEQGMICYFFE